MPNYFEYSGPTRTTHGESLPHIEVECGIYFVTFCLQDSVPPKKLRTLKQKREISLERLRRQNKLTPAQRRAIDDEYFMEVDKVLDAGHGSQLLARDDVAEIVANSMEYFHRERYDLDMWSIMGTHVHVNLQTRKDWWLKQILHSWKSYTANEINKLVGRKGRLWQADYYDRLLRSEEELDEKRAYVWLNPTAAGFDEWKWRRQYSDRWKDAGE